MRNRGVEDGSHAARRGLVDAPEGAHVNARRQSAELRGVQAAALQTSSEAACCAQSPSLPRSMAALMELWPLMDSAACCTCCRDTRDVTWEMAVRVHELETRLCW